MNSYKSFSRHIISAKATVRDALSRLNTLGHDLTLFVVDDNGKMVGTLTDGDIRRALVRKTSVDDGIEKIIFRKFSFMRKGQFSVKVMNEIRQKGIYMLPVLDESGRIIKVINLHKQRSCLPLDAVIMAGGDGRRLRPLTEHTPKPLLKIGDKPILEHIVDRLALFGIEKVVVTLNYLGSMIEEYFGDGSRRGIKINYIHEPKKLGTAGALSLVKKFSNHAILLMNSDLLTNIDYEDFYAEFEKSGADLLVATLPYSVNLPYAVFETREKSVVSLSEKPTYVYQTNAGIYLLKPDAIRFITKNEFFNATDLIESLLHSGKKVSYYPLYCYWLDIGNHQDFLKAQEDAKHIKL